MYNLHQRPGVTLQLYVVVGTINNTLDLIHVGLPVDLCICKYMRE